MYLPGIFTTSDIINCKIFVAFQASSICCIRVSPWCFSGANLCNCDIAISNLPIISQLQSQSQMGHPPPHLYYPRQFHAPPAPWLSSLFATIISRSSLWNSTSVSIDACAPCCPYPPPPSHRASLPSPSSLLLLMRVSSRCSVSSAAGSSACSYFAELHVYSHTKKIVRTITTAIAVLVTLIMFIMTCRIQKVLRHGICRRLSHIQTSIHLSYVFYCDGTLLFIPWVQMYISSVLLTDFVQSSW